MNLKGESPLSDGHDHHSDDSSSMMMSTIPCSKEKLRAIEGFQNDRYASDDEDMKDEVDTGLLEEKKSECSLETNGAINTIGTLKLKLNLTEEDEGDSKVRSMLDKSSVSTPPDEPKSQFWSLQGGRRSSVSGNVSKNLSMKKLSQFKMTRKEPRGSQPGTIDFHGLNISPFTSPAAICTIPSPTLPTLSMTRTRKVASITTRENLEGSGPKVRLTRAALLRLKANEKQHQQQRRRHPPKRNDNTAPKPTPEFLNKQQKFTRLIFDAKKRTTGARARGTEPRRESPRSNLPQITTLPGRRSRPKPTMESGHTGKVRLTRSSLLKLRQSQERANKMTLQDMDNRRLGIPPVKYLEIPSSPTRINFEDDEMEHPNDVARRKLRELFDGKSKATTRPSATLRKATL